MSRTLQTILDTVASESSALLRQVDAEKAEAAAQAIVSAPRIYCAGAGRSALAIRGFAMRLMHLGLQSYVAGDVTTPAIRSGDLLIIGSGSGRTPSLVAMGHKARSVGARLLLITIDTASPLAELADLVLQIPAPSPKVQGDVQTVATIQPMGALFEQCCWLVYDALVVRLMDLLNADPETMFSRHANLE